MPILSARTPTILDYSVDERPWAVDVWIICGEPGSGRRLLWVAKKWEVRAYDARLPVKPVAEELLSRLIFYLGLLSAPIPL